MFTLGGNNPQAGGAGGGDDLIFDVTDQTFMEKVVTASQERPVLVDFWAPWCGPCKQLGPAIEQVVREAGGKVALAKINIDENPQIAGQMRVQSIPAVFAFAGGQPVDGFMGALPPSQIKQFVDQVLAAAGGAGGASPEGPDIEAALEAAEAAMAQKAIPDAAQIFADILRFDAAEVRAISGLARCYAAGGDMDRARQALSMAPPEKADDPAIIAAKTAIDLAEEGAKAKAALASNRAALEADPNNHQARLDLALALVADDDKEGAVDELLEIFRRDRNWNDEAAKTQLMKLFEAFGPTDPVTLAGRRRLSSMIFA